MPMQKQRTHQEHTDKEVESLPESKKADLSEIDNLLDEIDELIEDEEKRLFKEKLRSLSFNARKATSPCADTISIPQPVADALIDLGVARESSGCCEDCE